MHTSVLHRHFEILIIIIADILYYFVFGILSFYCTLHLFFTFYIFHLNRFPSLSLIYLSIIFIITKHVYNKTSKQQSISRNSVKFLIESFKNGKETEYECLNAEHDDALHLRLVACARCTALIVQVPTGNFRYELYFLLRRNRLLCNVLWGRSYIFLCI